MGRLRVILPVPLSYGHIRPFYCLSPRLLINIYIYRGLVLYINKVKHPDNFSRLFACLSEWLNECLTLFCLPDCLPAKIAFSPHAFGSPHPQRRRSYHVTRRLVSSGAYPRLGAHGMNSDGGRGVPVSNSVRPCRAVPLDMSSSRGSLRGFGGVGAVLLLLRAEKRHFLMGDEVPENVPLMLFQNDSRPTVCVTCAGAGTAKPSSQKNDKA